MSSRRFRTSPSAAAPAQGTPPFVEHAPLFRAYRCSWSVVLVLSCVIELTACTESSQPTAAPVTRANAAAYVTGAAARSLNAEGQFVLPSPNLSGPYPQLTKAQAVALATGILRDFARFIWKGIEAEHGAFIDSADLRPCPEVYYAESPYQPPGASVDRMHRNFAGPYWLVSFCSSAGVAQLSVPVAAYATNMILRNGHVGWTKDTRIRGAETFPKGIPLGTTYPVAPENAVELVASETGRRVKNVPELIQRTIGYPPQYAVWKLVLDAPVPVRVLATAAESDDSVLYVGADEFSPNKLAVFRGNTVPGREPPEILRSIPDHDVHKPRVRVPLVRSTGVPRDFERVAILPTRR